MAADRRGNLFVSWGSQLIALDGRGRTKRLAGRSGSKPGECCISPTGIVADRIGNVYVADSLGRRVWFINRRTVPVTNYGRTVGPGASQAVAGTGLPGFGGDGGLVREAQLQSPQGLALDKEGNLYLADAQENTIRKIDRNGVISTVAGTGTPGFNGDGLSANLTTLNGPTTVSVHKCELFIADTKNDRVRMFRLKECVS